MTEHLGRVLDCGEVVHTVPAPQQIGELQQLLALPRIQPDADRACKLDQFGTLGRRQRQQTASGSDAPALTGGAAEPLQVHQQQRYRRRCDAGYAGRLAHCVGTLAIQPLPHFDRKSAHCCIVEVHGNAGRFVRPLARDFVALTLDVAGILDLDFDLLGDLRIKRSLRLTSFGLLPRLWTSVSRPRGVSADRPWYSRAPTVFRRSLLHPHREESEP